MRTLISMLAALAVASAAYAQTTAAPAPAPAPANDFQQQLEKLLQSQEGQQKLQQGFAVSMLMGCTSKRAGKAQTDGFYKDMQVVGKQVEALCKAQRAPEARGLVLATLKKHQYNQVVMGLNNCYATQKTNFDAMAGDELANEAENYARWLRDPALAEREMTDQDICK